MKEIEKNLKALANKRRLAILKFLNVTANASVGQVAKEIKLSFKATSKHLGILHSANILEREQVSLQMYYTIIKPLPPLIKCVLDLL